MPHTYTSLRVHIVFSTKDRRALSALEERLFPYFGGIVRELNGQLIAANGAEDPIHLLAHVPPTTGVSEMIGKIKGSSSGWIHKTFPDRWRFAWQRGFGAFSVSPSQTSRVVRYIERQKEHHHRISYRDEFVALLESHGISPNERFLWT